MKGVEPSSSAWKAEIISRYMTSAKVVFTILILWIIVKRIYVKRGKKMKEEITNINLSSIISPAGIVIRWPRKKEEKLAVLDYLITKFEAGVEYKEIQVNMILKKWHSFGDHALLRRELYDNYYMDRNPEKGIYWVQKNNSPQN